MANYSIFDRTAGTGLRDFGPMGGVSGFVVHHSGGRGTVDSVISTLRDRGLGAHFVIDREGNTYQIMADGQKSAHILPSRINNLNNGNSVGVEVIANDDRDVLPIQVEAAKKLISTVAAKHGFGPEMVFGHGEVNPGHKDTNEGMTIVNEIRKGGFVQIQGGQLVTAPAVPPSIQSNINEAAARFGINPQLMHNIAKRESNFDPNASNPNSSAKGLFAFTEGSWEKAKAIYGRALGIPDDASRLDPKYSALMAGATIKENMLVIKQLVGRDATEGELYLGHFLGGPKAVKMIKANNENPEYPAAAMFPAEAAANPTIFYKDGMPRSIAEVYKNVTGSVATGNPVAQGAPVDVAPTEASTKQEADLAKQAVAAAEAFKFQAVSAPGPAAQKPSPGPQLESETERIASRVAGRSKGLLG